MRSSHYSLFQQAHANKKGSSEVQEMKDLIDDSQSTKGCLTIPSDVEVRVCQNPVGKSLFRTIEHAKVKADLFATPPSMQDIKQGYFMGDCFLLAGLHAIYALQDGETIIRNMLKDMGDYVVVRMFDDYRKPHYLAIDKSVPTNLGILSAGALWVKLLEKAYVVFHGGKYSVLDKGNANKAIAALTGATDNAYVDGYCSLPVQARSRLSEFTAYVNGNGIYALHELMRISDQTPNDIQQRVCELVFNRDKVAYNLWKDWIKDNSAAWKKVIDHNHPLCLDHLMNFFKQQTVSIDFEPVIKRVCDWVMNEKILSGHRYSHHYSYDELDLFASLKARLAKNCPVTVSSGDDFDNGILPNHSYAVIGVEDNSQTRRKYIYVRNPYGEDRPLLSKMLFKGGRTSIDIKSEHDETGWEIQVKTSDQSTSRMELSDFCYSFMYIDAMESVAVQEMNKRVEKFYSKPDKNPILT